MKKRTPKRLSATLIAMVLMLSLTLITAQADGYVYIPYDGYSYDIWNEAVPSAVAYRPQEYILGLQDGESVFAAPTDMVIDQDGLIYVLNEKDNGIVVLDQNYKIVRKIDKFQKKDGEEVTLMAPNGLFVKDGLLYIADTDQEMAFICDMQGTILHTIVRPEDETYPAEALFRPQKILKDETGMTYILIEGIYQGAAAFDENYEFVEFYGSNRVEVTADILAQEFWRLFMTEDMIDNSYRNVPVEYTNFDIDHDGFIYTCTATNETSTDEIRKLNAVGDNILPSANYGDQTINYYKTHAVDTNFVDLCVNMDGFIYALDQQRGRIFVYDSEGQEVFIFGGKGSQLGAFQNPVAIDNYGQKLFVLDSKKNAITVFTMTEYGQNVYEATVAFMDGRYEQSKTLWENVITQNANCKIGYVGIGKALYQSGELEEAMRYFELGGAKKQESQVFNDWRQDTLRDYADIGITVAVIILLVVFGFRFYRKRRQKRAAGDKK